MNDVKRPLARLKFDHGTNPINFQYIIATKTPPPEDLGSSASTVLTLDARDDKNRLLGIIFSRIRKMPKQEWI